MTLLHRIDFKTNYTKKDTTEEYKRSSYYEFYLLKWDRYKL